MNRRFSCIWMALGAALALVLLSVPSAAAVISDYPILAMTPNAGDLQIGAGGTDGWGFVLYNRRPVYLVVTSGDLAPSPAGFGTFDPFLGISPVIVGPGSLAVPTMLTVPYDFFARTGFGSITVDAGVPDWTVWDGSAVLLFDEYARSPLDPLFDPEFDTISIGQPLEGLVSVQVIPQVPEPSSAALALAGAAALALLKRKRG